MGSPTVMKMVEASPKSIGKSRCVGPVILANIQAAELITYQSSIAAASAASAILRHPPPSPSIASSQISGSANSMTMLEETAVNSENLKDDNLANSMTMLEETAVNSENLKDDNLRHRKPSESKDSQSESNRSKLKEVDLTKYRCMPRCSEPVHKCLKESPLSSDAIFHQSHAGLFNLCIVILFAVNSRLIIENLMKYGLLIGGEFWFTSISFREWPLLMCGLSLPLLSICSFLVEKLKVHFHTPELIMFIFHFIISSMAILYPVYVILRVHQTLLSGVILMLFSVTCWMKLVSYAHTNYDLRDLASSYKKDDDSSRETLLEYPDNITLKNFVYFMVAPTLCYQVTYPHTERIRKRWVLRQVAKLFIFTGLMGFIAEQYINPTIKNSQHPLKGNYLYALERILKLSIPTLYNWLCLFYCLFHLWLNIIAELTYFGDREFYKDWWNAKTVEEYWKSWNMPVHKWMVRHVYIPCLRRGMSKNTASVISFAISGIFHELIIGIPCHLFTCWAFLGIMLQLPLMALTNYLHRRFQSMMVGNYIFWFFFCIVGQPISILLYYHDYMNQGISPSL